MARVGATAWARSPLFVAITALLLASAVGISADDDHDGVAPTLLVSLDGFRASYLDAQPEDALPNLNAMWRGGVRASLYPRFISKTFPNHYSIVTGLQEEHHGIVANHMWDPRLRAEFNLASTESEWWNEGEPIWVTASRARITNKVYFWPGSEALIRKHRPDVYFKYDISVTYEHRVDVVSNWVKEAHADVDIDTGKPKPAFMALYFDEPDHTGHVYGPASDEVKAAVRRVDESIGRLRMNVGEDVWNATNVVVVSDHGMAQLSSTRVVNLADGACGLNFTELFVTGDGVAAHLWRRRGPSDQFPSDVQAEDARFDPRTVAARITACHPNVTAWAKEDVPPRLRYSDNARIGPVVVAADVGWLMCGHGTFDADASGNGTFADLAAASAADPANWALRHVTDEGCAPVCDGTGYCGTHGYDNTVDEMRAAFLASGPLFRNDGARLVGELGYESSIAEALLGADAVTGGVHGGTEDDAARWEARTLGIDNINVYAIVAAGLGINLDGHDGRVMADGFPPPFVDGAVDEELANVLFRDGVGVRAKPNSPALVPDEDEDEENEEENEARKVDKKAAAIGLVAVLFVACAGIALVRRYLRYREENAAYMKLGSMFEPRFNSGGEMGDGPVMELEMPEVHAPSTPIFASLTTGGPDIEEAAESPAVESQPREGDENA